MKLTDLPTATAEQRIAEIARILWEGREWSVEMLEWIAEIVPFELYRPEADELRHTGRHEIEAEAEADR